ncbi:AbrB/MazE/SpoVT family DNA-binding domain-containing protein [Streptomyces sp. SP17BM10]|uniref:AbrB/MazE/SpoVT family DNA-binding domain-containing protein n=1 Tax=Streptomyces sp. SP17BM10 TaxID=3002530 RepID=UPI003FCC3760
MLQLASGRLSCPAQRSVPGRRAGPEGDVATGRDGESASGLRAPSVPPTTPKEPVVTTAKIGQRGRLILPAKVQQAAYITSGDTVSVRVADDGTITIEPLHVVRTRLRTVFTPLFDGHLPAGPARLLAGGGDLTQEPILPSPEAVPVVSGSVCAAPGRSTRSRSGRPGPRRRRARR